VYAAYQAMLQVGCLQTLCNRTIDVEHISEGGHLRHETINAELFCGCSRRAQALTCCIGCTQPQVYLDTGKSVPSHQLMGRIDQRVPQTNSRTFGD
jgi:hypothetical protein